MTTIGYRLYLLSSDTVIKYLLYETVFFVFLLRLFMYDVN